MIRSNLPGEIAARRGEWLARASFDPELDRRPFVKELRLCLRASRSLLSLRCGCSLSFPGCNMAFILKGGLRGDDLTDGTSSVEESVNFLCTAETTSLTVFVE